MPQATWDQQILQPIRLRVLNFLRLWVELRFADFDYWLMKELNQFIAMIVANGQHQRFADNLTALVRKKVRTLHTSNRSNGCIHLDRANASGATGYEEGLGAAPVAS